MRLKVLKIKKFKSKRSDYDFYYIFMKSLDNGKSYKTCISPEFRNYRWWCDIKEYDVIDVVDEMIRGNLVDADCIPKICKEVIYE